MQNTKKTNIVLLIILIIAAILTYLFISEPKKANLTPVSNLISDKATLSKHIDESIATTYSLKNVFFGDLHVHTSLSYDAYLGGNIAGPNEAYRYAKGEAIEVFGRTIQNNRALDFAAITDHAEYMGEIYTTQQEGEVNHNAILPNLFRLAASNPSLAKYFSFLVIGKKVNQDRKHYPFFQGYETTKKAWSVILNAAEKHYQPGKFSTLVGYEWSYNRSGGHLHRNVLFRDMVVPDYPISAVEAKSVEALWASLEQYTKGGAKVLAISHNPNISSGHAFNGLNKDGKPIDATFAQLSQKYEPLVEIHQVKGNSEVHPSIWKNDEFADFETHTFLPARKSSYVRHALKKGLELESKLGINPYKFGLIASTDTHSSSPGNTEEKGKNISNKSSLDLTPEARSKNDWVLQGSDLDTNKIYEALNPGGLVAVWAPTNTRGAIWDALQNREAYATSGGRIQIRFFGGFDFDNNYSDYESMVQAGYEKGIPMGGDLTIPVFNKSEQETPSFLIWAKKDAESANLDRVQVIKGWYKNEQLEEKIYTVAFSDNRVVGADGAIPDNGATVNLATGEWDSEKGATELSTVWKDPDFDPTVNAFYYVRVLEIPTPRWILWDAIRYGSQFPEGTAMTIRERAWSSPIWYTAQ